MTHPQQPAGYPPLDLPPPPPQRTNTMAILALIFAFLVAPLGIVFGFVARGQIRRTGEGGRGLATAGLVLGIVFTVIGIAAVVLAVLVVAALPKTLRTADVQDQVARTTQSAAGVAPSAVHCPDGQPVRAGYSFECTADLEGQSLTYTVTEQDDQGNLHFESNGFVVVKAVVDSLQQQIGAQIGAPVTATCDTGGKSVYVGPPGSTFTCTVADAADPTTTGQFTVRLSDTRGNVTFAPAG